MKNYKKLLKAIKKDYNRTDLERYVANDILYQYDGEVENFVKDLLEHGCISGTVSGLIYYKDTHKFFDKFSDDIFALIDEIEESTGQPIEVKDDRKNFYAWLGYEETVRKLASELGIEG